METKWIIIAVIIIVIVLVVYLIIRNWKDKEELEKFLNETELEEKKDPNEKEID